MNTEFLPTRAAGIARLQSFAPRMGGAYAHGRNTDSGPEQRQDVSMLSPYLRRRLITEAEVVALAVERHGDLAEKFVHEVVWRSYFKGWLEQHPSVWSAYLAEVAQGENRLATEGGMRRVYHDACAGRTGIDGFDDWAIALVRDGWLHNHSRMWFASIWIFTLRLPWALGAAFFLRHLIDGDPASNTLSWRWVAGLHTTGKHYVARADNIARYTNGRFNPAGQLDEAPESLVEAFAHPQTALVVSDPVPAGDYALLLHDDDLCPHSLGLDLTRAHAIGAVVTASGADPVRAFADGAMDDLAARLGREVTRLDPAEIGGWRLAQTLPVVTAWAPVGPNATLLEGMGVFRVRRAWDSAIWPHATRGFFQVKQRLPRLLEALIPPAV